MFKRDSYNLNARGYYEAPSVLHAVIYSQTLFLNKIQPTQRKLMDDSRARLVYSDRTHRALVAQHLDKGFFLVR